MMKSMNNQFNSELVNRVASKFNIEKVIVELEIFIEKKIFGHLI